jgi:tetratricopeptide (TPR) repeat protein
VLQKRRKWSFRHRKGGFEPAVPDTPKAPRKYRGLRAVVSLLDWGTLLRLAVFLLVVGAVFAGAGYGVRRLLGSMKPRTISVCVATDWTFREERPDAEALAEAWLLAVNRAFEPAGIIWSVTGFTEAYPVNTEGSLRERRAMLAEHSNCQADVLLGLTGAPDADAKASVEPFSHSLLVAVADADFLDDTTGRIAESLAALFGAPVNDPLPAAGASSGPILNAARLRIVRELRGYDFSRGVAALSDGWEGDALDALVEIHKGKSARPRVEARRILAASFSESGYHAEAVRQLREAVREAPNDFRLRLGLAVELKAAAESDSAIVEATRAAAINPASGAPHAIMGAIYMERRRSWPAIDEFRTAARLEPSHANFHAQLGFALQMQPGRSKEALAALKTASRLRPEDRSVAAAIDALSREQHFLTAALARARSAARNNPTSAVAQFDLAFAESVAGQHDEALAAFEKALSLDPSNGRSHLGLARLQFDLGDYALADSEARAALAAGIKVPDEFLQAIRRKVVKP